MAEDTRPRTTVDKTINLTQLDAELGGVGLSARLNDDGNVTEVVAPDSVTQQQLEAAVAEHTATTPEPDVEWRDAIRNATDLDSLKAILAGDDPSVVGHVERRRAPPNRP